MTGERSGWPIRARVVPGTHVFPIRYNRGGVRRTSGSGSTRRQAWLSES